MFSLKVFPDFKPPSNASQADSALLSEFRKVRQQTSLVHMTFSVHDYRLENPDSNIFVTYPLRWVTEYFQNNYMEIDPLLKLDYRRVNVIDWLDIQNEHRIQQMFQKFQEFGLGSNGLTITGHICKSHYGAMALTFEKSDTIWPEFKKENLDFFRFLTGQLCDRYIVLFQLNELNNFRLTRREIQCLYWVALGKTDNQIAELMKIGKWTVVSHVKSAKNKLDTPNRASAVAVALSEGLIDIRRAG